MCHWTVIYVIHMEERSYLACYKNLFYWMWWVLEFLSCLPNVWTVTLPGAESHRCQPFLALCNQMFYSMSTWSCLCLCHMSPLHILAPSFLDSFPHLSLYLSNNLQLFFFFFFFFPPLKFLFFFFFFSFFFLLLFFFNFLNFLS